MSLWKRTTPNQMMAEQIGWQSEKSMQRGWNLMHKVSGHHDINFLTPINSPQASLRRGGWETSSRGESSALFLLHHNQPPLRALLREGFWASSESSPSEWEPSPYGIYVSNNNHLKPPWSKTLPVAAWRPSFLFYFHFSPSCLYFVNDIRENDLFS